MTKESKPVSRRNAIGKHLLYNILYFLVDKRIKCICTWFCQHLAPDFKGNGKSGYVCQRLSTHQFYVKSLIGCLLGFVNTVNHEMCTYYFLKIHKDLVYSMGIHSLKYNWRSVYKSMLGKHRHTDILTSWQRVAICQKRQPALDRT